MKKLTLVAVCAMMTACGGGGGGSGAAGSFPVAVQPQTQVAPAADLPKEAPKVQCRIAIYGDSIIADPLLTETMPASIRRQRPDWVVDNYALGGQNSHQGAPMVLNNQWTPNDVVVLEWGVNDSKLGTSLYGIESAARYVKSQGAKAVITGLVRIGDLTNAMYNDETRRIAEVTGSAFVSWNEREITTFDGTHPDQISTDMLVEDLINTLDKECP